MRFFLWNYRVIHEFHGLSVQLVLDRIFDNADLCISQGSIQYLNCFW